MLIVSLVVGAFSFQVVPAFGDTSSATSEASPGVTNLSEKFVSDSLEELRLQAASEFLRSEISRLENSVTGASPQSLYQHLQSIDAPAAKILLDAVTSNKQPLVAGLDQATSDLDRTEQELLKEWRSVRATVYEKESQLFEAKIGEHVAGQLASMLSVDNRWFWLFGLIAIAALVGIAMHDRRHEMRRWLNGGRARAMGLSKVFAALLVLLVTITGLIFFYGDAVYNTLVRVSSPGGASPQEQFTKANQDVAKRLDELRSNQTKVNGKYEQAATAWKQSQQKNSLFDARSLEQWEQARTVLEQQEILLFVQEGLSRHLTDDAKRIQALDVELAVNAGNIAHHRRVKQWIRGGLGMSLVGFSFLGGIALMRGISRRTAEIAETCPLCLSVGTLEPVEGGGLDKVRCTGVVSHQPYEECEFEFHASYQTKSRICIPTLGMPGSGKTHSLAMLFNKLNTTDYYSNAKFNRIQTKGAEAFDNILRDILHDRIGSSATQTERISDPVIFQFSDHDLIGPADLLVNIFDFSGEVTVGRTLEDAARRRALDAEGFFFFLDPTQPSEVQAPALVRFAEDIRLVKGVNSGKQLHTPVALCVSKIDLMATQPYGDMDESGVISRFYRGLADIGWATDLASIQARSKLLSQLRDTVWPGWQIERQIHDLFGGRHMFFPMTPVGLNDLGESDLSRRTISPVGLLDPLLWLLHMNGYRVLK